MKITSQQVCNLCGSREYEVINKVSPKCLTGDYEVVLGDIENVVCCHCGLAWNRSAMAETQLVSFYGGYSKKVKAEDEDDLLFDPSDGFAETLTQSQINFLFANLRIDDAGNILDVGCGKGAFLKSFKETYPRWNCFGIEPSAKAAEIARRNTEMEVYEGMLGAIDIGTNLFDLVAVVHVLEHMSNPFETIRGINRLLKLGGHVFVEVPNVLDLNMFYDLLLYEHLYHFCPKTLSDILQRYGFEITLIDTSTTYGATRIIARKVDSTNNLDRLQLTSDGYQLVKGAFREWSGLWESMCGTANRVASEITDGGKRVVLFGAGMTTAALLVYTDIGRANIVGLLDESPWKIGQFFFDHRIYSLGEINDLQLDLILIATIPGSQDLVYAKLQEYRSKGVNVIRLVDRS